MPVLRNHNVALSVGLAAPRRASMYSQAWEALSDHAAEHPPRRVSFEGVRSEREAEWCALGGRLAHYHALVAGSDQEAEAACLAVFRACGRTATT